MGLDAPYGVEVEELNFRHESFTLHMQAQARLPVNF